MTLTLGQDLEALRRLRIRYGHFAAAVLNPRGREDADDELILDIRVDEDSRTIAVHTQA